MSRRIEMIYPGYGQYAARRLFMGWPEDQWIRCGYASPTLGQATSLYPRLEQGFQDRLYLAGEYTSLLSTGFVEGGSIGEHGLRANSQQPGISSDRHLTRAPLALQGVN